MGLIIVLKGAIDMPPRPLGPRGPRHGERGGLGAGRPRRPGGFMPPPPLPRPRIGGLQNARQSYNQDAHDASNMSAECPNCGANATGSRFCTYCGTELFIK
ncbi:MAG: zinc ribbon domain-containing protein [Coprococcus sp.]|nr:zinc ribbon domain-containing protein [Coprococcus sp.]